MPYVFKTGFIVFVWICSISNKADAPLSRAASDAHTWESSGCPPDSSEGNPKGTLSFVTGVRLNFMKTSLNVETQIRFGSVWVSAIYDDRGLSCDDLPVVFPSVKVGCRQLAGPSAPPSPSWASL